MTTDAPLSAIARVRVLPVVTIADLDSAAPLASTLVAAGLTSIEVTLRTDAGLGAIDRIRAEIPDAIVGAGTVTSARSARLAVDAGAQFLVSPGWFPDVLAAAHERATPALPGVATPTELVGAVASGHDLVKLFPAEIIGGVGMVTAMAALSTGAKFIPTGGIDDTNAAHYLQHESVVAVGGSWMVPADRVEHRDWPAIGALAEQAAALAAMEGRR